VGRDIVWTSIAIGTGAPLAVTVERGSNKAALAASLATMLTGLAADSDVTRAFGAATAVAGPVFAGAPRTKTAQREQMHPRIDARVRF
jgi:hypothetical protein